MLANNKGDKSMKALDILQEIDDVVVNKYHKTKSITFYENDIIFIKEAISELETLQSRSCDGCYWWSTSAYKCIDHKNELAGTDGYCCNRYEPKEQ